MAANKTVWWSLLAGVICVSPLVSGEDASAPEPQALPFMEYQVREPLSYNDRMEHSANGETLYSHTCGYCHLEGGMATNLLTLQRLALGEPPQMGLLVNRTDLTKDYIKAVVRNGKGAMPRLTGVDVTDQELARIANFLEVAQ